ncbi:MAG TPA: dephospho-CoA kinase [Dehalococcoidales bacterium]|nr:dephospho-CoA kinase [Dehalococcoidales bacterium]
MKIIGLTGGIGSGKSTVSHMLAELGATVLDADEIGHAALKPDTEVRHKVVAAFGRQILTAKGNIDRNKLGKIVFDDAESLSRLNRIMHPRMYDMAKAQLEKYREQGVGVVVLEAPLLIEANWTSLVDEVWVTVAPEPIVLKRLQERTGLSTPESLARIHSQMSNEERLKHADLIIDTDCNFDELRARVEKLWRRLQV